MNRRPRSGATIATQPIRARFQRIAKGRATGRRPTAPSAITHHLVLAYRPSWQSLADLNAIAGHVTDIEPSIRTFIVPTTIANSATRKQMARCPTLVVSPGQIPVFKPPRGKVYQGRPIPKFEELRRLEAAGVPVPRTAILTRDLVLDPAVWGEFVIVKPTDIATSSHGRGIQLMRTPRVRYIAPKDYPAAHPGRRGPMMVQQFIDTGDRVSACRVLTLFGEPLSAVTHASRADRVGLDAPDEQIEQAVVAIQGAGLERDRALTNDPEILRLAAMAHEALPEIPLKGTDLLYDVRTDKWYVIEMNCGGNTWHFSSRFFAETRKHSPDFEIERRKQFDAMRTAARVLARRTLAEAE